MENYLPVIESERMNGYARLAVERHNLLRTMPEDVEEDGGTETQWRIEDKMAGEWQRLDDGQRQAVSGLASDLAWVRRKGELAPKSHPASAVEAKHIFILSEALKSGRRYEVLYYVRVCLPIIGNHLAGVMRASLYREAFGGAATQVFSDAFEQIHPMMPHPVPPFSPNEWGNILFEAKRRPWPHFWFEFWEEVMHRGWPFPESLKMTPASGSLGDRLSYLMLSTLPWPLGMSYIAAAAALAEPPPQADG